MDDDNEYVAQLKEVFDSCDTIGAGLLNRSELTELCTKLQLDSQTELLVDQLIAASENGRVQFDDFKEGFVNALSSAVDLNLSSDGESKEEVVPKYVQGGKKYGRRSRPDFPTDTETDYSDTDLSHTSPTLWGHHQTPSRDRLSSISSHGSNHSNKSTGDHAEKRAETFEAEGQLNQSMADVEYSLDPVSQEQYLRGVWREARVGQTGYINVAELSSVCSNVGMGDMSAEDLQQLFDKLDTDRDGQVSFDEFLNGLFQHGGSNMPSTPIRPVSSVRKEKLRIAMSLNLDDTRTQTPALILASSGAGIFTQLDKENAGYLKSEDIIEFWEGLNIENGADILKHLDIDLNAKVNLQDLSNALEQEMVMLEEDNAVYQAAVVTYQQELKHLKNSLDHVTGERDKLKIDLNESNVRNIVMVKETDERHVNMEKLMDTKTQKLEKKYKEQIKSLQNEIESERELMTSQASRQKRKLETNIDTLRDEESRMKENVIYQQKESERLEKELHETTGKLMEFERINFKLQKDLESAEDLRSKLAEMESNRALLNDEQHKFIQQKMVQLQSENKELRDKNDESTMEIEALKQQLSAHKKRRRERRTSDLRPQRSGSILSDYTKPNVTKRGETSTDNSEEDSISTPSRQRRKLPSKPKDYTSNEEGIEMPAKLFEVERLKLQHEQAMKELEEKISDSERIAKDEEIKRLKEAHDLEISKLEQRNVKEKGKMERQYEKEKRILEEKFANEKVELTQRLKEEFEEDLEIRINTMNHTMWREKDNLERSFTRDKHELDDLLRQKVELELQLKLQKEELELGFNKEKSALRDTYLQEKHQLEEKYRLDLYDYENIFVEGEQALKGRLREDFYSLLKQYEDDFETKCREELLIDYEREKNNLCDALRVEKQDLEDEYRRQLEDLEQQFLMERDAIEQDMADHIREDLEDEFMQQVDQMKATYQDERQQLEDRIKLLTNELEEREYALNENLSNKNKEAEYRKKVAELNKINSKIKEEKFQDEIVLKNLRQELQACTERHNNIKQSLEDKIKLLTLQKDEAITSTKEQQLLVANTSMGDKMKIESLKKERDSLNISVRNLDNQVKSSDQQIRDQNSLEIQVKELEHQKQAYKLELDMLNNKVLDANTSLTIAESQYVRDLQSMRDQRGVDPAVHAETKQSLSKAEQTVRELEQSLNCRSTETNKLLTDNQLEQKRKLDEFENATEALKQKYQTTCDLLKEVEQKFILQLQKNTRSGYLVKDLYIENAQLMKALAVTEERKKYIQRTNFKLEDKCQALNAVLVKVSHAALWGPLSV